MIEAVVSEPIATEPIATELIATVPVAIVPADGPAEPHRRGRCRGEHGNAMVTALVLLFSFTAGAVIWLARDVDRTVSNRSIAASIAFQAARSGAQQVEIGSLRSGAAEVVIDREAAADRARSVADRLFDEYGVAGTVRVRFAETEEVVTVTVTLVDPAGDVTGVGSARPETGP